MSPKTSSRYSVFLLLLVFGQEFCAARYAAAIKRPGPLKKREAKENDEHIYNEEIEHGSIARVLKKRGIGRILTFATFGVMMMGIGFEVYNKIDGCCGMYPSTCIAKNEFLEINRTEIYPVNKDIQALALKAELLKEDLLSVNSQLRHLWMQLERIGEYEMKIIKALHNKTVEQLVKRFHEIKKDMALHNRTMQTVTSQAIDTETKSAFDNVQNSFIRLTPLLGHSAYRIIRMFTRKAYKVYLRHKYIKDYSSGPMFNQLLKASRSKAGTSLGIVDVKASIKNMATIKAKVKSRWSKTTSRLSVAVSVITIGYEIFNAVERVNQCKDVRDEVKKARDSLKAAAIEIGSTKRKVQNFYNYMKNEVWRNITDQLTNDTFHNMLREMGNLTKDADVQSRNLIFARKTIQSFLEKINDSKHDAGKVKNLQEDLIKALKGIKFLLKCFYNRIKLLDYVERECKKGYESLSKIFNDAINSFDIKGVHCEHNGVPYATYRSLRETIEKSGKDRGWNIDCKLNNADKQKEVCNMNKCDKIEDVSQIANQTSLTVDQVNSILQTCTSAEYVRDYLTPKEQSQVCRFFRGASDETIKSFLGECVTLSAIQAHKCT